MNTKMVKIGHGLRWAILAALLGWGARVGAQTAATPALGANLEPFSDWSTANMFVDLMKQARPTVLGVSFWPTNWTTGPTVPPTIDANGWPTQDVTVLFQTNALPEEAGAYNLSFNGTATVSPTGSNCAVQNQAYDPAINMTTAQVVFPSAPNGCYLNFSNADRGNGGGPGLTNIKLIRPGYPANTTQLFTNEFLNMAKPMKLMRFMDVMNTNNNPSINWSDRTLPTQPSQFNAMVANGGNGSGPGIAWEYVVALANTAPNMDGTTGKDIWINVPVGATDDYVTNLAGLIKSNLNPGVHVYVEYANELWNTGGGFWGSFNSNLQQAYCRVTGAYSDGSASPDSKNNMTVSCVPPSPLDTTLNMSGTDTNYYQWSYRRVAERLVQIANGFAAVYCGAGSTAPSCSSIGTAANPNGAIRPVLAGQVANPFISSMQLNYLKTYDGAPGRYIYGIAGAPYYDADPSIQSDPNMTAIAMFNSMAANVSGFADPTYADSANAGVVYANNFTLAQMYGVKNLSYEMGPDTTLTANTSVLASSLGDPRWAATNYKFLAMRFACGGDESNYYTLSGGGWGMTDDVYKLTEPRYTGSVAIATTPANGFECQAWNPAKPYDLTVTALPNPGSGTGLTGQYFNDTAMTSPAYTQINPMIYFNWAYPLTGIIMGGPGFSGGGPAGTNSGEFGVRWTGSVLAPTSETLHLQRAHLPSRRPQPLDQRRPRQQQRSVLQLFQRRRQMGLGLAGLGGGDEL